ncbi:VOC family protein [Allokutzneria sp. A3M-2-11 16]|uniref:VOC family protein n=1 Tax=Allokutzneria sp. A3M-2-11 16 TaxID=2962043 RepID=UPI0020B8EC4C|nr:VOC family protein [Allokutzneria sp. A3M-2-11 16]MCP3803017.1 VOC family protein [Allokutzneria sp. A3M-2-11 16]
MASTVYNVAFDCANPYELAAFWEQVVGHPQHEEDRPGDEETVIELPTGMNLYFQRVPEGKAVKNRVHVCLRPDRPRDAEIERLLGIGATLLEDKREPDGTGWAVLGDPEGNEFCVLSRKHDS